LLPFVATMMFVFTPDPPRLILALALLAISIGPVVGFLWARRAVPEATRTSVMVLAPIYVAWFFWHFALWCRVRGQVQSTLVGLGMSWQRARTCALAADPLTFGLLIFALVVGSASWASASPRRDAVLLAIVAALVIALIVIVPLAILWRYDVGGPAV